MKPNLKKYLDSPEARQRLFQFYRQAYPTIPEMVDDDHFQWQTFKNPVEDPSERPLIWLLESETGELVGHNSIFKYPMSIDSRYYQGYCSTNLIVKPGMEGRGIGHILIENNENLDGVAFAYGPTPASLSAFQKRGWVPLFDARLHTLILNPFRSLRFLKKSAFVAALLSPALKALAWIFRFYRFCAARRRPEGVTYRSVDKFEPEWDDHWKLFLKDFGLYYIRRSDFLNYKYAARPDVKHDIFIFEKSNRPVGYVISRTSVSELKNIRLGRIVELVANPELKSGLMVYMVRTVIDQLLADKVDSIAGVACNPDIEQAYKRNGMFFSRKQIMLVKETDFSVADIRSRYKYIWYLSLGDADIDNYW